jgi:toluene monooxygenase system ferredoxin subunit
VSEPAVRGGVDLDVDGVELVPVADADELWDGEMEAYEVDGEQILIVKLDGRFHAYQGICPHQSIELVEGQLDGHVLTCRAHEWSFDVRTGAGINPATTCLAAHLVQVDNDQVLVSRRPIARTRH